MASRNRPSSSASNSSQSQQTPAGAPVEKSSRRSFFSRNTSANNSKNSSKRNSTSSTGSTKESEDSTKKKVVDGSSSSNVASGKSKTESSPGGLRRKVPSFLSRKSSNQPQQKQQAPVEAEQQLHHRGPDPHTNPSRFPNATSSENCSSSSDHRLKPEETVMKKPPSPSLNKDNSDSGISASISTSSISSSSISKPSTNEEPLKAKHAEQQQTSPNQQPGGKRSGIPTSAFGRSAAFSPPPQSIPQNHPQQSRIPSPANLPSGNLGSSNNKTADKEGSVRFDRDVPYPAGLRHSKKVDPSAHHISAELWEKTCKKIASLTRTVQTLTIAMDKKEAELAAFGNDRKLEENHLNETIATAKKECSEWQQRCLKAQGEAEAARRSFATLQEQWKSKEMKLIDEHQDKMNKLTLSIARQQDTFEKKFHLLEKTQKEVEESHSRASAALKMHHAKELQDVGVKHDLIMKNHLRQLEERLLMRGERLDRNLAVVEQSLQERLIERDHILETINSLKADFKSAQSGCQAVERTSSQLEVNLEKLRHELERVKEQAADEIRNAEQKAMEEAEGEVEARRREYSLSLSAIKSASREVLENLAKQFRPLAYSCQCPQRIAMRGAQVCLTCLVKRIIEKARKEEEAWKKREKDLAAKEIEWADKERQWKEKEDSLSKRLKETTDRLKTKEDETGSLRREATTARDNLDKARREAESLRLEVNSTRNRISELQENLRSGTRMSTKLLDLEKDYDAAKQNLATKEGDLQTMEKLQRDMEVKCRDAESQLREAEAKRQEVENKCALLAEERDQLSRRLERLETEREELIKAKRCDVCEREDEFKFIQEALEEALQERELIQQRFEKEFEAIRTMSSDKEQQMMEDFEWKLREIEKEYKHRMEEKEREAEEKLKHVRETVEERLSLERKEVEEQKRIAEEQLSQVSYLKSYEPELRQLQGLVNEQQKALRFCYRACDKLKSNETNLLEELKKTRQQLEQWRSKKAVPEEKVQEALQKLRNQLNSEWEDKLKSECSRLKCEMDQLHLEEKRLAMEGIRAQNERHIQTLQETWQKEREALQAQIDDLSEKLKEGERCIIKRTAENSALKLLSASVEDSLSDSAELSEPESSGDEDQKEVDEKFHLAPEKPDLRAHCDKNRDRHGGRPVKFDAVALSELAKAAVEEAAIREAAAKAKTAEIIRAHEECMAAVKNALEKHNIPWDSLNIGSPFAPTFNPPATNADPGHHFQQSKQTYHQPPHHLQKPHQPPSSNSTLLLLGPGALGEEQTVQQMASGRDSYTNNYRDYDGNAQQRRHNLSPSPANYLDDSSR